MSEVKFAELQKELFRLFENEKLGPIFAHLAKMEDKFPEKLDKTSFWRACLYSIQGNTQKAVMVLDDALKKGFWWNPKTLTKDQDLQSLLPLDDFQTIIEKCKEIIKHQKKVSRSELFVYGNQTSETGIFSIHWKASNVKEFAPYWFNKSLLNNYLFGFPQSSQVYGFHSYCWDHHEMAQDELANRYLDFQKMYNPKRTIYSGTSQGGTLAIELCLKDENSMNKGFITVIPAIRELSSIEKQLKKRKSLDFKCAIITGDQDPFYQKTNELISLLESYGIQCQLTVKEGLGHYFPEDFSTLLPQAVHFILQ